MFRQDRTNPSKAVSNWKGRLDSKQGHPSTAVSLWLNGGLFGGFKPIEATGGTYVSDFVYSGFSYRTHDFRSSGTFTITANPEELTFDVLMYGGGGGHGAAEYRGGNGSGGVTVTTGVAGVAQSYTIQVGAGGTGNYATHSSFAIPSGTTYYAGGGGYSGQTQFGQGGGASGDSTASTPVGGGYAGGARSAFGGGGGGGGTGGVGTDANGPVGGSGGPGGIGTTHAQYYQWGFGGGGGGGTSQAPSWAPQPSTGFGQHGGGSGGYGAWHSWGGSPGAAGTANTGGGAGGAGGGTTNTTVAGGSGVVKVVYALEDTS
jgi:hypothetical protein|tara:strand:+ start:790 stop:1737 length:948 start_codon:yes stop_codon:yes gene_type:complete